MRKPFIEVMDEAMAGILRAKPRGKAFASRQECGAPPG